MGMKTFCLTAEKKGGNILTEYITLASVVWRERHSGVVSAKRSVMGTADSLFPEDGKGGWMVSTTVEQVPATIFETIMGVFGR